MKPIYSFLLFISLFCSLSLFAQYPIGTITNSVEDEIIVENKDDKTLFIGTISNSIATEDEAITPTPEAPVLFSNIKLYPNPFSSELQLSIQAPQAEEFIFSIHSIQGQLLLYFTKKLAAKNEYNIKFSDMSRLTNGIYIYTIQTSKYTQTGQLIKVD